MDSTHASSPDLLMGLETEYALAPRFSGDDESSGPADLGSIIRQARQSLTHLPAGDRGLDLYLGNGSRLYLDVGLHLELSTPECTEPTELVRYLRAGDRIVDGT